MSIWKKIVFYLLGVGLGVLIVSFLFGGRELQCSYFPNDRVLYDMRKKVRVVSKEVQYKLEEARMDTSDLSQLLLTGDVDFEKSRALADEDSCKTYWVNSDPEHRKPFSAEVLNCDSTLRFLRIDWQ